MQQHKSIFGTLLVTAIIVVIMAACAKPYHFYVKYDLTESAMPLKGQKVFLQVLDGGTRRIFSPKMPKRI